MCLSGALGVCPEMHYDDPACADCPVTLRACCTGDATARGPGFCPAKVDPEALEHARRAYADPEVARTGRVVAEIESAGYGHWTRVRDIIEFAKRMSYGRIGIAACVELLDLAGVFSDILRSHGFSVISVCCKNDSIPKEELGVLDSQKLHPGTFEPTCNPIAQAELLNAHNSELNVLVGLCVGHDSLFHRYAHAPTTTLVVKDRALGHNSVAALQMADGYFADLWGPGGKPTHKRR